MSKLNLAMHVRPYTGNDAAKRINYQGRIETANRLEEFLRSKHDPGNPRIFDYYDLAVELNIDKKMISELLRPVGGGSNGFTY